MTSKFRQLPLDLRIKESKRVLAKHTDKVPVIIEPANGNQPKLQSGAKHLVPASMTMQGLLVFVRRGLPDLPAQEALSLFIESQSANGKLEAILVPMSSTVGTVYNTRRSEDGFLYIVYSLENTFGSM